MEIPDPHLSLIVPVYNESARLSASLHEMGAYLARMPFTSEIVIADDGSTDDTLAVAQHVAGSLSVPVRLLHYELNRGKGGALKLGFAAARGERLVFTDCDLSTPLDEMEKFLERLDAGSDFVIGSRKREGAEITKHQPRLRENLGKVFTWIVRMLIADVTDMTCGFKAYRREVGKDLFSRMRVYDWSFDAELLLIARHSGYRHEEVPVRWEDHEGTKVNLVRDIVMSLIGIVRIRINHALGRYDSTTDLGVFTEKRCGEAGYESSSSATT